MTPSKFPWVSLVLAVSGIAAALALARWLDGGADAPPSVHSVGSSRLADPAPQAAVPASDAVLSAPAKETVGSSFFVVDRLRAGPVRTVLRDLSTSVPAAWERARVDPDYAYDVWRALQWCAEDLPRLVDLARQAATVASSPPMETAAERTCSSLPEPVLSTRRQWLIHAADGGSTRAQLDYVIKGSPFANDPDALRAGGPEAAEFATRALKYLEAAAQRGSVDALLFLSGVYETGVLVRRDLERSYAYYYAAAASGLVRNADAVLQIKERELTPFQVEAARKAALKLAPATAGTGDGAWKGPK